MKIPTDPNFISIGNAAISVLGKIAARRAEIEHELKTDPNLITRRALEREYVALTDTLEARRHA